MQKASRSRRGCERGGAQQLSSLWAPDCLFLLTCLRAGGVSSAASGVGMMSPSLLRLNIREPAQPPPPPPPQSPLWFTRTALYLQPEQKDDGASHSRLRKAAFSSLIVDLTGIIGGFVTRRRCLNETETVDVHKRFHPFLLMLLLLIFTVIDPPACLLFRSYWHILWSKSQILVMKSGLFFQASQFFL